MAVHELHHGHFLTDEQHRVIACHVACQRQRYGSFTVLGASAKHHHFAAPDATIQDAIQPADAGWDGRVFTFA